MTTLVVRRIVLAAALLVGADLISITGAFAEDDHLAGHRITDLNRVPGPEYITLGGQTCKLKTPRLFLVQSEKNAGDDPRGGPAGHFVCYRARCDGPLPPVTDAESQLGLHRLQSRKTETVCLPVDRHVCGDDELDPGEECDGTADAACPGYCSGCTCVPTCPATGGDDQACTAYTTNTICRAACCNGVPACSAACAAAETATCQAGPSNDACATQINGLSLFCLSQCCGG
jgi:hypothetical protein